MNILLERQKTKEIKTFLVSPKMLSISRQILVTAHDDLTFENPKGGEVHLSDEK